MEYIGLIGLSLLVGIFMGAYWMFLIMYKDEKSILEELSVKNKELKEWKDRWANKYVDDDE